MWSIAIVIQIIGSMGVSVRAMGLSDAYTAMARGVDAMVYNPANLAMSENPGFSVRILGIRAPVGLYPTYNNSFSISQLDRFFYSGDYLDNSEKTELVNSIPEGGFTLGVDPAVSVLEFQIGKIAFGVRPIGGFNGTIPKALFDLALFGNELGRSYSFQNEVALDLMSYINIQLSSGIPLNIGGLRTNLGFGLRYIIGLYYADARSPSGQFYSDSSELFALGELTYRTAQGGRSWGVDIGIGFEDILGGNLGVSILNINPGMKWDREAFVGVYSFETDPFNLLNIIGDSAEELFRDTSWVDTVDYIYTSLPSIVRIGYSRRLKGDFIIGIDLKRGLTETALTEKRSILSLGLEWRWLKVIVPRFGIALGGREGVTFSYGYGLYLSGLTMNLGIQNIKALFGGSKGGRLGIEVGLNLS